jgi:hypothetical protein
MSITNLGYNIHQHVRITARTDKKIFAGYLTREAIQLPFNVQNAKLIEWPSYYCWTRNSQYKNLQNVDKDGKADSNSTKASPKTIERRRVRN